jgi:uncharacterized delta-60 repeat protein
VCAIIGVAVAIFAATAPQSSTAASAGSTVGATVLSSTSVDPAGCLGGTPNATSFGTVPVLTSIVTSNDCAVQFGSSNNTATLRIRQNDQRGVAMSQPSNGSPDTSFGPLNDGKAVIDTPGLGGGDGASDALQLSDGKFLILGHLASIGDASFSVSRLNTNGTLDSSYAGDGTVTDVDLGIPGSSGLALVRQETGRIVAVSRTNSVLRLVGITSTGTLDTSFASSGLQIEAGYFGSLITTTNDDIVMSGRTTGNVGKIHRYNEDGIPRTSFGTNGVLDVVGTTSVGTVVGRADGALLACSNDVGGTVSLRAFLRDGAPDPGFGTAGVSTLPPAATTCRDVAVASDGWIYAVANANLYRVSSTGTIDALFGGTGSVATGISGIKAVIPQGVGRVVVGGDNGNILSKRFFTATGVLDTTYGVAGAREVDFGGTEWMMNGGVFDDGRLWFVGPTWGSTQVQISILAGGATIPDYVNLGGGSDRDWSSGPTNSMFGVCVRNVAGGAAVGSSTGSCTASDADPWRAVTTTPASVAATSAIGATATANLRFGMRTASNTPPGSYVAPIAFSVVAP